MSAGSHNYVHVCIAAISSLWGQTFAINSMQSVIKIKNAIITLLLKTIIWATKMDRYIKVLVIKSGDPRSTSETHISI